MNTITFWFYFMLLVLVYFVVCFVLEFGLRELCLCWNGDFFYDWRFMMFALIWFCYFL